MMDEIKKDTEIIPFNMWKTAFILTSQSFAFGYFYSCLNSCLVAGKNNDPSKCFSKPGSCPNGSIYNDLDMSTIDVQLATALIVLGNNEYCNMYNTIVV